MTEPLEALERYGIVYNCPGLRSHYVHINPDECRHCNGETKPITHRIQLPLSATVCRVCDPDVHLKYNDDTQAKS